MEFSTKEYFTLKEQNLSRAQIAEKMGLPEWKLKKLIAKYNCSKIAPTIGNTTAFAMFSEEECYWAGFLAADGNVDSKKRVRIMLNYDDTSHLEKFRQFLRSTHSISSNTDKYYRSSFEFTNKTICDNLRDNYLIVPNKTSILEFPVHCIPYNMLRHYIRGYFDGDGSICESFSNINSTTATLYATFTSGSRQFVEDLFLFLSLALNLGGHLQYLDNKCSIKYNTNDAKVLLTWIYSNSVVYLDRKFSLYTNIVENNQRTVR